MANKDASRPELSLIYNYIACEKQEKTELDKNKASSSFWQKIATAGYTLSWAAGGKGKLTWPALL